MNHRARFLPLLAKLQRIIRRFVAVALAVSAVVVGAVEKSQEPSGLRISLRTERAGTVQLNIYRPDGALVRRLIPSQKFAAGSHQVVWDGRADDGAAVEPGEYTWRGLFHEGIGLKLCGWAANGGAMPWSVVDGKENWGGDAGVPSAVAADAQSVYLGWSLAEQGNSILACDLEGRVRWGHRRSEGASGCKALAVDDGTIYVLGGLAGVDAEGGAIYMLSAKDGKPVPWPGGAFDLKIASFWPADARTRPDKADGMAVRHGHIYLTFTSSEFLTVLNAKTGEYLQTVVGAPPGLIDVAPTQTDLPDAPGKLVDADFAVISLGGGVLGKVLFAHDPLWVVVSEFSPLEREVNITALSVIGDGAKFHRHTAFVGFGAPYHQVEARPLLHMEAFTWFAGRPGGRPLLGPWQADALRNIRSVALAADGRLWVAEGDAFPKRFTVWDTTGRQGRLVREFFGPAERGAPGGAINPLDPSLMFAQGCEWRIDRQTGRAMCLGVVTREPAAQARFGIGENGHAYLVVEQSAGALSTFERVAEGDYKLRARLYPADAEGRPVMGEVATQTIAWADENDDGQAQPGEQQSSAEVLRFHGGATLQNLALTASAPNGKERLLTVQSWSGCGAPRYDLTKGPILPSRGQVSADGGQWLSANGEQARLIRRDPGEGDPYWNSPVSVIPTADQRWCGVAKLAPPLGNVWLSSSARQPWLLVNEDGFKLAEFFQTALAIRWPKKATPGADMTSAAANHDGSLTQAADGRLYLQTGDSAYWNLEVTGLDKVKALPGGKITVPATK